MVNQEKINEWTAALRSGNYRQATGVLAGRNRDTYCCLGLLCVLNGGEVVGTTGPPAIEMGGNKYEGLPPIEMVDTLGLDVRDASVSRQNTVNWLPVWDMYPDWGDLSDHNGEAYLNECSIAALNDGGFTFEQIADIVDYFGVR